MNERIRRLRNSLGLSQSAFGKRLGLKQTTIAGYETGGRVPNDAVISLLCREFNVNENWLRTGEGSIYTPQKHDILNDLAMEYHLSDDSCALIRRFIELDENIQNAFVDYAVQVAEDIANKYNKVKNTAAPEPDDSPERSAEQEDRG